jgi:hypothetical protein
MPLRLFMGCVAAFLFASQAFIIMFYVCTFFQVHVSFSFVLAHALVLGLPIFLILWWKRWINLVTCFGAGFMIAAASAVFRYWPLTASRGPSSWPEFWPILILLGVLGAVSGLVFCSILYLTGAVALAGSQSDASGGARQGGARRATILAVVALLLTGAGYALSNVNFDRLARFF